jgi:hypothetical protein
VLSVVKNWMATQDKNGILSCLYSTLSQQVDSKTSIFDSYLCVFEQTACDFTTEAQRHGEQKAESVLDNNIKISLCLCVSVVNVL